MNMQKIIIKYADGGSTVKKNIHSIKYLGDEVHYFTADTDMGINHVTVVNEDDLYIRSYSTQSNNAIAQWERLDKIGGGV
jgi:hypothetical protein